MEQQKVATESVEAFMADYEALCKKHRIIIVGCGCCGSPWLLDVDAASADERIAKSLAHLRGEAEAMGLLPVTGGQSQAVAQPVLTARELYRQMKSREVEASGIFDKP